VDRKRRSGAVGTVVDPTATSASFSCAVAKQVAALSRLPSSGHILGVNYGSLCTLHGAGPPLMEVPTLRSHKASAVALVAFLIIFYFRFKLGSIVTATSVSDWYQSLHKAPFNPPNGAFSPVWMVLYFLMAISGWLVWRHGKSRAVWIALFLFGIQLAMNLGWSLLFFGMKRIDLALAEMILLLLVVIEL